MARPSGQDEPVPDDVVAALEGRRAELEEQLAGLTAPVGDSGGISFGKRVGDGTSAAVERLSRVAAHDRLRALLADVVRSQAKATEGSYGSCDHCAADIAPERLEALPWATRCLPCAAKT